MRSLVAHLVAASCFLLTSLQSVRAEPAVHVFLVFCNEYPGEAGAINESVSADRLLVKPLFNDFVSEQSWGVQLNMMEVSGTEATEANILQKFEEFTRSVGKDDTVYVHFSGHGAILDEQKGEQFLQTCDLKLMSRKKWADDIDALPCRLKILITDCCSSYPATGVVAEGDQRVDPWNHFYFLMMRHEGFVNITAASPGQAAYGTRIGGFLTVNLESDMQRFSTWKEVFESTRDRVFEETSADIVAEGDDPELYAQRPFAYSLGTAKIELAPGEKLPPGLQYQIPDSNRRVLSRAEIEEKSMQQLYLARK